MCVRSWVPIFLLALGACSSPVGPNNRDSIEAWMEFHGVPGVGVAVIKDFRLAYTEFYGVESLVTQEPVTPETLFQAASISKSVSAATVLTLEREGLISIDQDVRTYLDSWELPFVGVSPSTDVTIRRLLSHTAGTTVSGFRGYRYSEAVPTLIQILKGESPANSAPILVAMEPGAQFSYSGGGYLIMQQALLDVLGIPFTDLVHDRVLDPLGMDNSTYEQPLPEALSDRAASGYYANGIAVPGGHHIYPEIAPAALWTTPGDVARFLVAIQRSLRGDSGQFLDRTLAEQLLTEVLHDYGLGFHLNMIKGKPYFGHYGANDGFRCIMIAHPSSGDGLVVLTNSDRGSDLYPDVINLIGKREGWPGF
jgi:CubicO group peptidase (beta-lactamase class C family)